MRLKKIKLAGFKSFVDPTTVVFPSQLVGIVGPNGCGKSNVIDAVRWVMGESSAKYLRGESMTDVIFNGSASRKPVGQASIELVFDNTESGLGGQYASYNEISVKRQVNRESQSHYYLNGTRCRKRDITDVFLGTGLGPRSYAIIEQGMISRVIEAKPEELRVYLEEAAGISLYKERRRETERRMRGTHENLERLNDLRDEVGRQLEKLKRQAEIAERYKTLRAEQRQKQAELLALKLRALDTEAAAVLGRLRERETALEAEISRVRGAEREAEEARAVHAELGDSVHEIQGRYYAVGSEIARLEQQMAHQKELREKQARELDVAEQAVQELERSREQDREKLTVLEARLEELQPELEELRELEAETGERAEQAQEALEEWRARWERFNADSAEHLRTAQVERTRIEQLEQREEELARRRDRVDEERQGMRLDELEAQIRELADEEAGLAEEMAQGEEQLAEGQERLAELREQHEALGTELEDCRGERQSLQARRTSLETLQQAALGQDDGPLSRFLQEHGLAEKPRLAERLQVEPGWEAAVEMVLGEALQAVCLEGMDPAGMDLESLAQGHLMLFDPQAASEGGLRAGAPLVDKLSADFPLSDLFAGIHAAEDLAAAEALRARLSPGESVITRDGLWLGRSWLRIHAGEQAGGGVLERGREIERLDRQLAALEMRIAEDTERLEELGHALLEAEERREEVQDMLQGLHRRHAGAQSQLESREQRLDEARERREQLLADAEELLEQQEQAREALGVARARLQQALERSEDLDEQRERLQEEKDLLQDELDNLREQLHGYRDRRHELSLKLESATTARHSLQETLARLNAQRDRLHARRDELREALAALSEPERDPGGERDRLLDQRVDVERELNEARARLGETEHRLRELEQNRLAADQAAQKLREELEGLRLRQQELKVRRDTQYEQLQEMDYSLPALLELLPEDAEAGQWQEELQRLEGRIARLGSINLAAIEEYQQLDERKAYLDAQHEDLTQALETLESAIRKIDRETRQRFKETYEKVNEGVQRIFPRLFGGGQGYLELTGEDLLETGVAVMARPPGKRISNIHLLSGGEKALTAVALVFAIFELNPAPFCMLDEVDAPLDEANVGRFCEMLREMSDRVQFIFITHNKTTMEISEHLAGVTMQEPGVSRLVEVDVSEAVELAAVGQ
ncbi:chromosome segregation protein SMC [Alkalilimnicola sp. S0819]|uniref:chromosome segregation protein SMC n=1 Tax=Alkalilimnicola sp. S0819 TaxID=2613922 RepID=UPI001261D858|nr:chromosome segregation protein SMC [Alkalilimnicola sp. S0819]KAB7628456.1 chromosome segregation protein SMC [Alkalilimnicola sp. S0819]MPQ15363.1 chromosome segregation protein SMC [Alkalilimnicola sp. S0819]